LGFGKPQLDLIRGSTAGDGVCAPAKVIRTPQDLVDWLSGISVLKTSAATTATIAGRPGLTVDTNLNGEVGVSCADRAAPPGGLTLFPTSKELVFIRPGDRARLVVMDIGAPTPLIVRIESPTDVWDTALMRVQAVLDTLAISP
jgi:hypothetical protein